MEQTYRRNQGGELLYNLAMEGFGNLDDIKVHFKTSVAAGMGLTRTGKLDYTSSTSGKAKAVVEMAETFFPLWNRITNPDDKEKLLVIIDQMRFYPEEAKRLVQAFCKSAILHPEDLGFVAELFDMKSKYIREQLLRKAPDVMEALYVEGKSLTAACQTAQLGRLSPESFVAQLTLQGKAFPLARQVAVALAEMRDTPERRGLQEKFFHGIFGLTGNSDAEQLLAENARLLGGSSLTNQVDAIYQLGLLVRTHPEIASELSGYGYADASAFSQALKKGVSKAVAAFAKVSPEQVETTLRTDPMWKGNVDHLLALQAGWEAIEDRKLLEQYQQALQAIFEGGYEEWRSSNGQIAYLSENKEFWAVMAENETQKVKVVYDPKEANRTLVDDYRSVQTEIDRLKGAIEGSFVHEKFGEFRQEKQANKVKLAQEYQNDLLLLQQAMATLYGQKAGSASGALTATLSKYGLPGEIDFKHRSLLLAKKTELENLVSWIALEEAVENLQNRGEFQDAKETLERVTRKERFYRMADQDMIADAFESLRTLIRAREESKKKTMTVTIEETDHPAVITRMGALAPDLINCFNPNGNPVFNQFVVSALGSKNMKMYVVTDDKGNEIGGAMYKVKQNDDGDPVLFLERGVSSTVHKFRNEMLALMEAKAVKTAQEADVKPDVMNQIYGKPKADDPWVRSTGKLYRH